jgi:hypothetical protein
MPPLKSIGKNGIVSGALVASCDGVDAAADPLPWNGERGGSVIGVAGVGWPD